MNDYPRTIKYGLKVWVLALALGLTLIACNSQENQELLFQETVETLYTGSVPLLKPDSLPESSFRILDTRTRAEFSVSHLPEARWVGYEEFDTNRLAGIERGDSILLYCSVGYRSEKIGEKLQEMGFQHVYNLYGGIFWWMYEDHRVVDSLGVATQKVHGYDPVWSNLVLKGEPVLDPPLK